MICSVSSRIATRGAWFAPKARRILTCGLTLVTLGCLASLPAHAQLSYTLVTLDSTGLSTSGANFGSGGYAVGSGQGAATGGTDRAVLWNIATNTRTLLDNNGLTTSHAYGVGNGYVVGTGVGALTGGESTNRALLWNVSTNTRTLLGNTGLTGSSAAAISNGYVVGDGVIDTPGSPQYAMSWNIATSTRTTLNNTNLTESHAYAAKDGFVVGSGTDIAGTNAMSWNLTTNTRTLLDSTGLTGSYAYGIGGGYAAGVAYATTSSGATAWNLTTNTRIALNNTGLGTSIANGINSRYAVGTGGAFGASFRAQLWDVSGNTRADLQAAFLPSSAFSSQAYAIDDSGTITGYYVANGIASAYALVPFNAGQGDTLAAGKTAKVTGNLTQTTGTTTINGTYQFIGGTSNNTYTLAGGTLQGTGSITGNLNNTGGILSPGNSPGTFTVSGNYVQGAGGVMNMEIASLSSFDSLVIGGSATLGGTLNLSFASGFPNNFPASFDLIKTGGAITGFFDTVNIVGGLPSGATNYSLVTSSNGSGMKLTLVVVPEAGTFMLLGLPLLGIATCAVRRKVK